MIALNPEKLELTASPLCDDRREALKALMPEAFVTGVLDMEALLQALGEETHPPNKREAYGLNWAGKHEARKQASKGTRWTLAPAPDESVDWDTTSNLLIEADNLVALKLLKKAYAGKVDFIYIDPPYNVDADTIYNDDYTEDIKAYEIRSGKRDEEGNLLDTYRDKGHKHSQWLNMMYPRLQLLKQLLHTGGGVICISIDDTEVANLKLLMDEVFGEENFEGHIHWRRRTNQPNDKTKLIGIVAEHILVYANNSQELKTIGVGKVGLTGSFSNPDNDPRGDWASKPLKAAQGQSGSEYEIITPTGKKLVEQWLVDDTRYKELLKDNRIIFPKNGNGSPRKKYFLFEREEEGQCANNLFLPEEFGSNQDASNRIKELFKNINVFNNSKPTKLIQNLITLGSIRTEAIILDCFSGSGSTFEAVFDLNFKDKGSRKFIGIQLPEEICLFTGDSKQKEIKQNACNFLDSIKKPRNIAEITKERLRRAGKKLAEENPEYKGDLGFKVFKQVPSQQLTLAEAANPTTTTEEDLEAAHEAQFLKHQLSLPLKGLNSLHLAYEVLLKYTPYPLTSIVEACHFAGHDNCFWLGDTKEHLCVFSTQLNLEALLNGLIVLIEDGNEGLPKAVYMLENAFNSAGSFNDFSHAIKQLSLHCNIGGGSKASSDQPTLKFYTL